MSEMKKLVILGATASPEIIELIHDINGSTKRYEILHILDDNPELIGKSFQGVSVAGSLELVSSYEPDIQFIFAIGSYKSRIDRFKILKRLKLPEARFETLIHPSAKVYSSSLVGQGSVIHSGSIIFNESIIGPFTIIVANSVIGARNIIGKGCLITSLVSLTSDVRVGSYTFIGTHSSVVEGVDIGPGSMIGMRTFVTRTIEPGSVVHGDPMKIINKEKLPPDILEEWEAFKRRFEVN